MRKLLIIASLLAFAIPLSASATTVQVSAWGAGASGSNASTYRAGGGGAYSGLNAFSVTSGVAYTVNVGVPGAAGVVDTMFSASSTLLAKGALGATGMAGGSAASGNGDVKWSGGTGGGEGYGGGGAGGTTANGGNGVTAVYCGPNAGGGGGSVGGGAGGNGGNGNTGATAGTNGIFPGGGGGGSTGALDCSFTTSFGTGAAGEVIITATLGAITSATGGTHTSDATHDYWTFTSSGTWTPTFGGGGSSFISGLRLFAGWLWKI